MTATVDLELAQPLEGLGAPGDVVGGKAASLDRLIGAGAPVPAAAVVTTAAYRAFVADPALAALLERLQADHRPEADLDPRPVDDAFLAAPLAPELRAAILHAAELARQGGPLLVVRSSATAEDLGAASFAGQYRSVLGVGSDDEVVHAVRLVWASLWHPAPRVYRRVRGIDDTAVAMAALVMAQVPAVSSGVVFTVDPGGRAGFARVERVEGLADRLVSGAVTPASFAVSRARPAAGVPADVAAAATAALTAEVALGGPQDVEWAYDGRRLWVVQSRPITVAAGADRFDTPVDEHTTYTTAGIAEVLPGVLPPLQWTTAGWLLDESLRALLDSVGAPLGELGGGRVLVARHRGRAALDLGLVREAVQALPAGTADELEQQYLASGSAPPPRAARRRGRGRRHDLGVLRARRQAVLQAEVGVRAVDEVLDAHLCFAALPDEQLLALHARLLDLAGRLAAAQASVAAAAAASVARLEQLLTRWMDPGPAAEQAQRLTTGTSVAGTLNGVAVAGAEEAELPGLAAWAGSRAVFAGPTWDEAMDLVRLVAERRPERGPDGAGEALRSLELELVARPAWRTTRILTGQVVDVRLHLLRRAVADARVELDRRERAKAALLRLGGEVRRLHLEIGRRLQAAGRLDEPGEVDLLGAGELAAALRGDGPDGAALLVRRHHLAQAEAAGPLPHAFVGRPGASAPPAGAGPVLAGWGAGPGVAEGWARVVTRPAAGALAEGEVLVARTTDASWAPLFLRAAAVVVEEGGPLSHAAICARELGLPAVVNLAGVVDRLGGERCRVRVDGTAGTVTVLEPVPRRGAAGRGSCRPAAAVPAVLAPDLAMFVPAIMSVGVLYSLGVAATDLVRRLRPAHGSDRRTWLLAHQSAVVALQGEEAARRDRVGLRRRSTYAVTGAGLLALAVYVGIGEAANFARVGDYAWNVAWLLAVALLAALGFAVAGGLTLLAAARYERPPPAVRAFLASTPLVRRDAGGGRRRHGH